MYGRYDLTRLGPSSFTKHLLQALVDDNADLSDMAAKTTIWPKVKRQNIVIRDDNVQREEERDRDSNRDSVDVKQRRL